MYTGYRSYNGKLYPVRGGNDKGAIYLDDNGEKLIVAKGLTEAIDDKWLVEEIARLSALYDSELKRSNELEDAALRLQAENERLAADNAELNKKLDSAGIALLSLALGGE